MRFRLWATQIGQICPLVVLPGSHVGHSSRLPASWQDETLPHVIHAAVGDVLAMRPLLYHCSGSSSPTTTRHRRILHLELAASPELPEGFHWHTFLPAN